MPENLKPSTNPQSHAQTLREDGLRLLSRSPHPYHRQRFELAHPSERFNANLPPTQSTPRSAQNTDDEGKESPKFLSRIDREPTNSDSGTEADDEHFLKGLPAPRLRPHKGLRDVDGNISSSPSPLLSPAILEEGVLKALGDTRQNAEIGRAHV